MQRLKKTLTRWSYRNEFWAGATTAVIGATFGMGWCYRTYVMPVGVEMQEDVGTMREGRFAVLGYDGEELKAFMRMAENVLSGNEVMLCTSEVAEDGRRTLTLGVTHEGSGSDLSTALHEDLNLHLASTHLMAVHKSKESDFAMTGIHSSCVSFEAPVTPVEVPAVPSSYFLHGPARDLRKLHFNTEVSSDAVHKDKKTALLDRDAITRIGLCILSHDTREIQFSPNAHVQCVSRTNMAVAEEEQSYSKGFHVFKNPIHTSPFVSTD